MSIVEGLATTFVLIAVLGRALIEAGLGTAVVGAGSVMTLLSGSVGLRALQRVEEFFWVGRVVPGVVGFVRTVILGL